ncbi:MAG: hypothetical protein L6437_02170, partial [Kiritimatiellae bacterium]|nr:hypothetical protein [Kiritimatiellia bacterium]
DRHGVSFTHHEMQRAIKMGRKRWFLVQQEVITARSLFRAMSSTAKNLRKWVETKDALKSNPYLDSLRILDMYDQAVRDGIEHLENRKGNWVQPFRNDDEALLYIQSQLGRPQMIFPEYFMNARQK